MLRPVRSLGGYPQHQTAISGSPGSTSAPDNVRYLAQSREHILTESFTGRDPTRTIGSRTPREGTDRSEKKPSERRTDTRRPMPEGGVAIRFSVSTKPSGVGRQTRLAKSFPNPPPFNQSHRRIAGLALAASRERFEVAKLFKLTRNQTDRATQIADRGPATIMPAGH